HVEFVRFGLRMFAPTWLGLFSEEPPWAVPTLVVVGALSFGASVALNRRAVLAWFCLLGVLVANLFLHATSGAKTNAFGLCALVADRYYFELAFLVVIFVGAAFRDFDRVELTRLLRHPAARWMVPVIALCILAALAAKSSGSFRRIAAGNYPTHRAARDYMSNLRRS